MKIQKTKALLTGIFIILFFFIVLTVRNSSNDSVENLSSIILNSDNEKQIENLIENMTIEEKVGQTCQITLDAILKKDSAGVFLEPILIFQ